MPIKTSRIPTFDTATTYSLDECKPYVFCGTVLEARLNIHGHQDFRIEYILLDKKHKVLSYKADASCKGITLTSKLVNSKLDRSKRRITVRFQELPEAVMYIVVIVNIPSTFDSVKPGDKNGLEIECKMKDYTTSLHADMKGNKTLAKRKLAIWTGGTKIVQTFVRNEAWWRLHSGSVPMEGCDDWSQAIEAWQVGSSFQSQKIHAWNLQNLNVH